MVEDDSAGEVCAASKFLPQKHLEEADLAVGAEEWARGYSLSALPGPEEKDPRVGLLVRSPTR